MSDRDRAKLHWGFKAAQASAKGPNRVREPLSYCCFRHIRRGAASLTHAHCPLSSLFSSLFIHLVHLSPCARDLAEDRSAPIATPFFRAAVFLTIAAADNVSLIDIESLALACRGRAVVVDSFFTHSFRLGRLHFSSISAWVVIIAHMPPEEP